MIFGRSSGSPDLAQEDSLDPERRDVEAARGGDLEAFDRLVARHQDRVYNLCRWMLGDGDDAADAAQDAFVRAFRFLPKFRGDSSFSTWIGHIAVNVARDAAKRQKKAPRPFSTFETEDEASFEPASQDPSPSDALLKLERKRAVSRALGELAENFRVVLVLYDLQGHSYEECSALLGLPMGTVKSRLNRARSALREALGADRELFEG